MSVDFGMFAYLVFIIFGPVSEDHFLHLQGICPEGLLVMTGKKVAITSPVK